MRDHRFLIEHAGDPEYSLVTRSSDGQMLFLVNKLSKMKRDTPLGSRIAEVHNGSSLFTPDRLGQGESNIRRWIIENDWLEAIVALPLNMFYNTGIATYVWVLTNRKPEHRRGQGAADRREPSVVPSAQEEPGEEELRTRDRRTSRGSAGRSSTSRRRRRAGSSTTRAFGLLEGYGRAAAPAEGGPVARALRRAFSEACSDAGEERAREHRRAGG